MPALVQPLSVAASLGEVDLGFVVAMGLLALTVSALAAAGYRLVQATASPWHLPITLGVGAVAVWMNSAATIVEYVEMTVAAEPVMLQGVATNSVTVAGAVLASIAGARLGDAVVRRSVDTGVTPTRVGEVVQSFGRFVAVGLPKAADIQDLDGFEPVPAEVKETLGGATFRFSRGLTVDDLHARVTDRIRDDYQVGHVDLELDPSGEVRRLALGSRAAGVGPTLPPRKAAIGLPAATPPGASPGDRVRVWRIDGGAVERVGPAELRSADEGIATVVMDEPTVADLDPDSQFALATLRSEGRTSLEFASLLRSANETLRSIDVEPGSVIDGLPVSAIRLPVLGVSSGRRGMVPVPSSGTVLAGGDTVYAIGRHDELRRLETAATSTG